MILDRFRKALARTRDEFLGVAHFASGRERRNRPELAFGMPCLSSARRRYEPFLRARTLWLFGLSYCVG